MIETQKAYKLIKEKYLNNIESVRDNGTILDLFSLVKFCYNNLEDNQTEFQIDFEHYILKYLDERFNNSYMPDKEFILWQEKLKEI